MYQSIHRAMAAGRATTVGSGSRSSWPQSSRTYRDEADASPVAPGDRLSSSPSPGVHYIEGAPEPLIETVKELGLEGVVAKYSGAPYQGGRTSLWQKLILRRPEKGWRVEEPRAWRSR